MDGEARVGDGKEGGEGGGGVDNGQAPGIWKIPLLSDLGGSGPGGSSRHAGSLFKLVYRKVNKILYGFTNRIFVHIA